MLVELSIFCYRLLCRASCFKLARVRKLSTVACFHRSKTAKEAACVRNSQALNAIYFESVYTLQFRALFY